MSSANGDWIHHEEHEGHEEGKKRVVLFRWISFSTRCSPFYFSGFFFVLFVSFVVIPTSSAARSHSFDAHCGWTQRAEPALHDST